MFADFRDLTLAGAELPFIQRGAHPIGKDPGAGVTSVPVGGRPVELLDACERWGDRSTTISALSSLVERSGADIVIGPLWAGDSIAVREYARAIPTSRSSPPAASNRRRSGEPFPTSTGSSPTGTR